ncbi:MAG: hypothetical protein ACTSYA_11450 [Candidatus Kariarchaeaceae archaeon]
MLKEIDLSETNWVCIASQEIEGMRCSQCKQNFELRTYYDYDNKKKTDVVHCTGCETTYLTPGK